jgi:hypothetical protein
VVVLPDPDHLLLAAHLDAEPGGVPVQDRLQVGLLDPDPSPVRIGAPGRVDLLQPGEVLFRRLSLSLSVPGFSFGDGQVSFGGLPTSGWGAQ